MNKSELIAACAERLDYPKTEVARFIDTLFGVILDELRNERDVSIPRIGRFSFKHRDARMGKNPKTGESIKIPPSNTVKFKPGIEMKEAVNS